jgi:hypothetical protein
MNINLVNKCFLGFSLYTISLLALGQVPMTQSDGSTQFISGGIGIDESSSIKAEAKNWPLLIELSQKDGLKSNWISEVSIIITDASGNQILNQSNQGPMLLVGLKPGQYNIQAIYQDKKMVRSIVIHSANNQKISFQWR